MHYKIIKFLFFLFLFSCVPQQKDKIDISTGSKSYFLNKGFALTYDEKHFKDKTITGKLDSRGLVIFQKNLTKDTSVKVTNLLNSKYIIAKVGSRVKYPYFYNSVISKRINEELEIDENEPYVEIKEILESNSFIVKKAKTYDEEKTVADKAPVEDIMIEGLQEDEKKKVVKLKKDKFKYIIKIADFYFEKSANTMKSRISDETSINKISIDKLSSTKFRVFIGPFDNLNSLKKSFNAINVLEFDSIEIIKK